VQLQELQRRELQLRRGHEEHLVCRAPLVRVAVATSRLEKVEGSLAMLP
jgi:hypothetical protein